MAAKMAKFAVTPTALSCASVNVEGVAEEKTKPHRVQAHQLSIYNAPPLKSRYVDEKPGHLQTGISSVRQRTGYCVDTCKDTYCFIRNGITSSILFVKDAYVYLKNPPPEFLPKVGAVTISGLTGMVLARKGSRFKKIALPLGLCTLGISLCYPTQSVVIAKVTGKKVYTASHKTYEAIRSLWTKQSPVEVIPALDKAAKDVRGGPVSEKDHTLLAAQTVAPESKKAEAVGKDSIPLIAETKVPSVTPDGFKTPKFKPDSSLMDHGQSSPEDVDLYSTRS